MPTPVPTEKLRATVRDLLVVERASLVHQLESLDVHGHSLPADANFADSGQAAAVVGEVRSLAGSFEEQLRAVDNALVKLEGEGYGSCESCGTTITAGRLEAMPATPWCIDCASKHR